MGLLILSALVQLTCSRRAPRTRAVSCQIRVCSRSIACDLSQHIHGLYWDLHRAFGHMASFVRCFKCYLLYNPPMSKSSAERAGRQLYSGVDRGCSGVPQDFSNRVLSVMCVSRTGGHARNTLSTLIQKHNLMAMTRLWRKLRELERCPCWGLPLLSEWGTCPTTASIPASLRLFMVCRKVTTFSFLIAYVCMWISSLCSFYSIWVKQKMEMKIKSIHVQ